MKVFGCVSQLKDSSGIVLVAATSVEEAFLLATKDNRINGMFFFKDDGKLPKWPIPSGADINHIVSDWYPFECWKEFKILSADVKRPQLLLEESSHLIMCKPLKRIAYEEVKN